MHDDEFIHDGAFTIVVHTSRHDAVKVGVLTERVSRVRVSATEFGPHEAEEVAACLAVAVHGGMPTLVHHEV
jgi:hypothetical protein